MTSKNNFIFYPSTQRGYFKNEWLETYYSFSFANYYDPCKIHFGVLRVLNDDIIAANQGFGMHPHDNMEIITIVLDGQLQHKDDMGNIITIEKNEVQVMSAGKGILHSEYNPSFNQNAKILQLWMFPNSKNVIPKYHQKKFDAKTHCNDFLPIVTPNQIDGLWIYQNAWFYLCYWGYNIQKEYVVKYNNNGVYIFVIEGTIIVDNQILNKRDAIGIDARSIKISSLCENTQFLLIDLPLIL